MSKSIEGDYASYTAVSGSAVRHGAAWALHRASRLLARWARQVRRSHMLRSAADEPALEFHAQADTGDGALYADGKLVGYVQGVTRL